MYKKYFFITLLLAIFFLQAWRISPTREIFGDGGDNLQYFAFMHVAHENIVTTYYPFSDTDIMRYPIGFSFGSGYDGAFATISGAILLFILPLELTYNIVILVIVFLNIFVAFLCFYKILSFTRSVNKDDISSIYLAALFFGWSPYVAARIQGHINLSFIAGLPLLLFSVSNLLHKSKDGHSFEFRDIFYVFFSLLVIAMGSLQYLLFATYISVVVILICILINESRRVLIKLISEVLKVPSWILISNILIFCSLFLYFFAGYLVSMINGTFETHGLIRDTTEFYPSLMDFLIPNQYVSHFLLAINHSTAGIEKVTGFGIVGNFIAILILVTGQSIRNKLIGIFILVGTVLVTISPHLPFISENSRIIIFSSLFFSLLIVLTKGVFTPRFVTVVLLLFCFERFIYVIPITSAFPLELAAVVKNQPGMAVLNIPIQSSGFQAATPYYYKKKIVDGYFHFPADTLYSRSFINQDVLELFQCKTEYAIDYKTVQKNQLNKLLINNDIRTIVLHKTFNVVGNRFLFPECVNMRSHWNYFFPPVIKNTSSQKISRVEIGRGSATEMNYIFESDGTLNINWLKIYPLLNSGTSIFIDGIQIFPTKVLRFNDINNTPINQLYFPSLGVRVTKHSKMTIIVNESPTTEHSYWFEFKYSLIKNDNLTGDDQVSKLPIFDNYDYEVYSVNSD